MRSAGVFQGYYKQPEATARGADRGRLAADRRCRLYRPARPSGHRRPGASDVGKLADGTALAPQFVENKLKFSPYIGEAVVFGDGRPFVAAIVAIDADDGRQLGRAAEPRLHLVPGSRAARRGARADRATKSAKCNAGLPEAIRIRRFLVLNKEFDADDDEITRTRKIRRRFVAEKYAADRRGVLRRRRRGRGQRRDHLRGRPQGGAALDDRDRRCRRRRDAGRASRAAARARRSRSPAAG